MTKHPCYKCYLLLLMNNKFKKLLFVDAVDNQHDEMWGKYYANSTRMSPSETSHYAIKSHHRNYFLSFNYHHNIFLLRMV